MTVQGSKTYGTYVMGHQVNEKIRISPVSHSTQTTSCLLFPPPPTSTASPEHEDQSSGDGHCFQTSAVDCDSQHRLIPPPTPHPPMQPRRVSAYDGSLNSDSRRLRFQCHRFLALCSASSLRGAFARGRGEPVMAKSNAYNQSNFSSTRI